MRALDLFSGACGGWSLGFHRVGIETVAACEADEWRQRQFARNFPRARLYDDVRTLTAARLFEDRIWPIDIVCGSPPCQDASTANTKGRGIDGERTGLYLEAVRLVAEIGPRWFAFENVPGIRNRGIDRVLDGLEQAGYACWPLVVGAHDLGAPHIRQRSWVIGADAATVQRLAQPWDQPIGNSECSSTDTESRGRGTGLCEDRQIGDRSVIGDSAFVASDADGERCEGRQQGPQKSGRQLRQPELSKTGTSSVPSGEQVGTTRQSLEGAIAQRVGAIAETWNGGIAGRFGVDDGLPKGMARPLLAAYGDAVVPQIAEIIGRAIMATEPARSAA